MPLTDAIEDLENGLSVLLVNAKASELHVLSFQGKERFFLRYKPLSTHEVFVYISYHASDLLLGDFNIQAFLQPEFRHVPEAQESCPGKKVMLLQWTHVHEAKSLIRLHAVCSRPFPPAVHYVRSNNLTENPVQTINC